MNITINENLKKLRREKGNTQEDLAEHLGISMQAVSKWERGEGCPDINLIPSIAFYYNVTADKLLGMDEKAIEAKIKQYEAKGIEVQCQTNPHFSPDENQVQQIALWHEAQKEFPNNHKVLIRLLGHLVLPVWNTGKYFEEIIQIGERLIAESTDNEIRFSAISLLCETYSHQKDFENAKKYANMVPSYLGSKEMLYVRCLSGEERIEYSQKNIQSFIDTIYLNFTQNMFSCGMQIKEMTEMLEFCYKLYHLVYSDGDFGGKESAVSGICLNLANWHSTLGDDDKALFYLTEMADHLIKSHQELNSEEEFRHTSCMVNRLTTPKNYLSKDTVRTNATRIIEQLEQTPSDGRRPFDNVKNDERYLSAINKLKTLL